MHYCILASQSPLTSSCSGVQFKTKCVDRTLGSGARRANCWRPDCICTGEQHRAVARTVTWRPVKIRHSPSSSLVDTVTGRRGQSVTTCRVSKALCNNRRAAATGKQFLKRAQSQGAKLENNLQFRCLPSVFVSVQYLQCIASSQPRVQPWKPEQFHSRAPEQHLQHGAEPRSLCCHEEK